MPRWSWHVIRRGVRRYDSFICLILFHWFLAVSWFGFWVSRAGFGAGNMEMEMEMEMEIQMLIRNVMYSGVRRWGLRRRPRSWRATRRLGLVARRVRGFWWRRFLEGVSDGEEEGR